MSKIWLDVTNIMGWKRPAVGTIRVLTEFASFCLRINEGESPSTQLSKFPGGALAEEPVCFCCFDNGKGYHKVNPDDVRAALDRIASQARPVISRKQKAKEQISRWVNMLPAKPREFIFAFVRRRRTAFDAALRAYRDLRFMLKTFFWPPREDMPGKTKRPATLFGHGDVYMSAGAGWNKQEQDLEHLYEQKRNIGLKILILSYDLIPIKLPHLCRNEIASFFPCYLANAAWCADSFLCISDCTRRDLQATLAEIGAPIPPMSLVRLGCQLPGIATGEVAPDVAQILGQRYILLVSTIERRKNHETIYRAYTRLADQGEKDLPLLVFAGMPGWGVQDLMVDLQLDHRTKDLIKILANVGDADLTRLYQNALFTVYPSLYEGWGLPVAESLATGKFCIASNTSSIPEVGGDLVEYLDPWDAPTWAERLLWYFKNPQALRDREKKIREEYQPTQWHQTCSQILTHAIDLSRQGKTTPEEKL